MRYPRSAAAGVCLALAWCVQAAGFCGVDPYLSRAIKNAVSEDQATAQAGIRLLRSAGPEGLEALLAANAKTIQARSLQTTMLDGKEPSAAEEAAWQRLRTAIDAVGGQRDCHTAKLYWFTDLEQAKAAAQNEGKPILSLRLLGDLTDEFSCANSRFFRTTLYSNPEVSRALRERFVLHWKSVRPVPKVTIDFGDGRKLERTLTGNSIHYVLDGHGRPIDALPGLYGPQAFLRELERAETFVKQLVALPDDQQRGALVAYHQSRATAIMQAWQTDLRMLGISPTAESTATAAVPVRAAGYGAAAAGYGGATAAYGSKAAASSSPSAVQAAPLSVSKEYAEAPLMSVTMLPWAKSLTAATTDDVWNRIAGLHSSDARLDPVSVALIRSQHPTAAKAAVRAISKMIVEDPLVRMVRNFQGSIALDTVRNEYTFHRQIHVWLADAAAKNQKVELDPLNERVYTELFLTPSSDPWLGLMPPDVYTGLDANGVVTSAGK